MKRIRKLILTCTLVLTTGAVLILNNQNKELIKSNKELTEYINNYETSVSSLSVDLRTVQEEYSIQKDEYDLLVEEKDSLQKDNKDLQEEYNDLAKENEELKKELARQSTVISLTQDELNLLYKLVFCEVGNEPVEAQIAVTNVIINRFNSDNFPNTVTEIIYQENQFSPVSDGSLSKCESVPDEVKESVRKALKGETTVNNDTLYFFATWVRTDHPIRNHVTITKTIGKTHFGK